MLQARRSTEVEAVGCAPLKALSGMGAEEGRLPGADAVPVKGATLAAHSMEEGGADEHKWGKDRDHVTIVREDKPREG